MKTSKFNYDPIIHTRYSRKQIHYVCNNCQSEIAILDDCRIDAFNKGICFYCRVGIFILKGK